MKLPGILTFIAFILSSFAFEDLGSLDVVRKKRPDLLIPGSVSTANINNVPCYVFAGQAEQCFSGDFAESDNELYEEAALAAKKHFFDKFYRKEDRTVVKMSNCSVLYRFNDRKIYTVVLFVPQKDVIIEKNVSATPPSNSSPSSALSGDVKPFSPEKAVSETPAGGNSGFAKNPASAANASKSDAVSSSSPTADAEADLTDKKIERLTKRIAACPDDALSHIRLGRLYLKKGDRANAVSAFKTAIIYAERMKFLEEEEKVELIYSTAELCEMINDYKAAIKYYRLVLKHKCSDDVRRKALAGIGRIRVQML